MAAVAAEDRGRVVVVKRMMRALAPAGLALSVAMGVAVGAAKADPIVVDAGWYGFCVFGEGEGAIAGCQNEGVGEAGNTFTFTAIAPVFLQVTDAFLVGDVFSLILDGQEYRGSAPGSADVTSNPDEAFASGQFSTITLALDAGSYSFDIFGYSLPFGPSGAYVQVVSQPVPEPAGLALLGAGLLGLGMVRSRRG